MPSYSGVWTLTAQYQAKGSGNWPPFLSGDIGLFGGGTGQLNSIMYITITSTGNTTTGNSTSALDATVVTVPAAFRILGFASPVSDAFPDVLVKINLGFHSMTVNTGI